MASQDKWVPGQAAHDTEDSLVGVWILDQFKIVRVLARGGMAQVYLAQQPAMERMVAIKIVRPAGNPCFADWKTRFRQEARAASRLQHHNIVSVYNFGELGDGSLFLAMEYLEGERLGALLQRTHISVRSALEIGVQCAVALEHAHSRGVIHRDFKPDNVMLTNGQAGQAGEVVKVLDFGIARVVGDASQTQVGTILGTPRYMGPEQCRGEIATAQSDQYALGLVLFEMLTGQPAIYAETTLGYIHAHQNQPPPLPSSIGPSPELKPFDGLVMKMLAKEPANRFPNMGDVVKQLNSALKRLPPVVDNLTGPALPAIEPDTPFAPPARDTEAVQRSTIRMQRVGNDVLDESGWVALGNSGLRCVDAEDPTFDICLVGLRRDSWMRDDATAFNASPPERTLVCIDAPLEERGLADAVNRFRNVFVGPRPVDPTVLSAAIAWLHCSDRCGIEGLLSDRGVQLFQVTSTTQKAACVESLLEDARAEGLRPTVLQGLAELAEEMLLNAIFHAPVDAQGFRRYARCDRGTHINLGPGEDVAFRWSILRRFIAVSIRDRFGALSPVEVVTRITGAGRPPDPPGESSGLGMGLAIMSRAARHLIFGLSPGNWCEVLALVPRDLSDPSTGKRSVCVLQNLSGKGTRLGNRLRANEVQSPDGSQITLVGEINETCDLRPVFHRVGVIAIDLSGVSRVNSVGLRAWIDAARSRPAESRVILKRCSLAMVRQINMIPALSAGMQIESILVPYACARCGKSVLELLEVQEIRRGRAPVRRCADCRQSMQLDGLPEEYFGFLAG